MALEGTLDEIKSLGVCIENLETFDLKTHSRMLKFLLDRYCERFRKEQEARIQAREDEK